MTMQTAKTFEEITETVRFAIQRLYVSSPPNDAAHVAQHHAMALGMIIVWADLSFDMKGAGTKGNGFSVSWNLGSKNWTSKRVSASACHNRENRRDLDLHAATIALPSGGVEPCKCLRASRRPRGGSI